MVIVVVTFNRPEYCELCVKSLLETSSGEDKVLVIDNKSTDHTHDMLNGLVKECGEGRLFIHNSEINLGCAGGRNKGFEIAQTLNDPSPFIAMSDDDFYYHKGWMEISREILDSNISIGLVTCFNDGNPKQSKERIGNLEYREVITTSSMVMPKHVFVKSGGYMDCGTTLGWVSADFCNRIINANYDIVRFIGGDKRLVENMDHLLNSKNLRELYDRTGYNYYRQKAKTGVIKQKDQDTIDATIEQGKCSANKNVN